MFTNLFDYHPHHGICNVKNTRSCLPRTLEEETREDQDKEDDAHENEIWEVTDATEEDFGTTEGERMDLLAELGVVGLDRGTGRQGERE